MDVTVDQCSAILRELRSSAGLSRSDMAELMGVSDRTYARYESGDGLQTLASFLTMLMNFPIDALPVIFRHLRPDQFQVSSADPDPESCRAQLLDYFKALSMPQELQQWAFVLFGNHGSVISSQLQLYCIIAHLPMIERLLIAKNGLNLFELESSRGGLSDPDRALPNLNLLRNRIITIQQSEKLFYSM